MGKQAECGQQDKRTDFHVGESRPRKGQERRRALQLGRTGLIYWPRTYKGECQVSVRRHFDDTPRTRL